MSYTPNDVSQWTTGVDDSTGYPVSTMGYDMSQFPVTTGALVTTGIDMTTSTAFFDPMYSSATTQSFDPYSQYNIEGAAVGQGHQFSNAFDQDFELFDAGCSGNEDCSGSSEKNSSKKEKKRPPRKYTAEQLAKRREQNRKAQRSYRDRKDQRIKELEEQLAMASQQTEMISSAIDALRAEYAALTGASSSASGGGYTVYGGYPAAGGI